MLAITLVVIFDVVLDNKPDGKEQTPLGNATVTKVVQWNHEKGCTLKLNFSGNTNEIYAPCKDEVEMGHKIWVGEKCLKGICKYMGVAR